MEGVTEILGQTEGDSYSYQNQEDSSYNQMSGSEVQRT